MIRTRARALLAMTTTTLTALATAAALLPAAAGASSASPADTPATTALAEPDPDAARVVDPPAFLTAGGVSTITIDAPPAGEPRLPVLASLRYENNGVATSARCAGDLDGGQVPFSDYPTTFTIECSTGTAGGTATLEVLNGAPGTGALVTRELEIPIDAPEFSFSARPSKTHYAFGEPDAHLELRAHRREPDGSLTPVRNLMIERAGRFYNHRLTNGRVRLTAHGDVIYTAEDQIVSSPGRQRYRLVGSGATPWRDASFTVGSQWIRPSNQAYAFSELRTVQGGRGGGWIHGRLLIDGVPAARHEVTAQIALSHRDDTWSSAVLATTDAAGRFSMRAVGDFRPRFYLRVVAGGGTEGLIGSPSRVQSLKGRRSLVLAGYDRRTRSQTFRFRTNTWDPGCVQTLVVQRRHRGRWVTESRVRNSGPDCTGVARLKHRNAYYRIAFRATGAYLTSVSPVVRAR